MIQPWNTKSVPMSISIADQQNIRDYLIPNLLAFRAGLEKNTRSKVQEIRLIRNSQTGSYINGNHIEVNILMDDDLAAAPELAANIKDNLDKFVSRLGLTSRILVYDLAWLDIQTNRTFTEEIRVNSLLVYKRDEPESYISAKSCIDSFYEGSALYEGRHREPHECELLFEFITGFPLLAWSDMNAAISEAPINYSSVDDFIYETVSKHIAVWCAEYFLYTPKWIKCKPNYNNPFNTYPNNAALDLSNL